MTTRTTEETLKKIEELKACRSANNFRWFVKAAWMQESLTDPRSLTVAALGMAGEPGEAAEIYKKRVRGDAGEHVSEEALCAELGDFWFYFTLVQIQWGLTIAPEYIQAPAKNQVIPQIQIIVPKNPYRSAFLVTRLVECAAKLSGVLILAVEIGMTPDTLGQHQASLPLAEKLSKYIPQLCHAVRQLLDESGLEVWQLELTNMNKLIERLETHHTLRGSGSNR